MITAAFVDGDTLICAIPSKSKDGMYLVEVKPQGDQLLVTHHCPAHRFKNQCSHVREAVESYYYWKWWEKKREVVIRTSHIILQPEWDQIPVPGGLHESLLNVMEADCYAAS